jgi:histidine ammonia-lyase
MDKLKLAITKLSMLAERQLNFLLNAALNKKLPPFINAGRLGLNFGMQGMQYTATSTVAENQTLSTSHYIHSIPSNNDNQDIVSMGCNAAVACSRVIENTFEVLAIQAVSLAHAADIRQVAGKLCTASRWVYDHVRSMFPYFREDLPASERLTAVKNWMMESRVTDFITDELHIDLTYGQ